MNSKTLAKLTLSVIFSTAITSFPTPTLALSVKEVLNSRQVDGDFNSGTLAGTKALVQVLENRVTDTSSSTKKLNATASYSWLSSLIFGLGAIVVLVLVYRQSRQTSEDAKVLLSDDSEHKFDQRYWHSPRCFNCNQPMDEINSNKLSAYLSQPQQIAETIGSVKFEGWHCTNCHPEITSSKEIVLCRNPLYCSRFQFCSNCQEWTVVHDSKIIEPPTEYKPGTKLETDICRCCKYRFEAFVSMDKLKKQS